MPTISETICQLVDEGMDKLFTIHFFILSKYGADLLVSYHFELSMKPISSSCYLGELKMQKVAAISETICQLEDDTMGCCNNERQSLHCRILLCFPLGILLITTSSPSQPICFLGETYSNSTNEDGKEWESISKSDQFSYSPLCGYCNVQSIY